MSKIHGSAGSRSCPHHRLYGTFLLLTCLCLLHAPLQAQDLMPGMSHWSGQGSPTPLLSYPSVPYSYGSRPSISSRFVCPDLEQAYDAWYPRSGTRPRNYPDSRPVDDYQPDLTGRWRGSGGETVEIQRNRARIWGGSHQSCSCIFFLVGQRLIAYSPDTDMVRKYWYQQTARDQFSLIDERGNLMSFRRVR